MYTAKPLNGYMQSCPFLKVQFHRTNILLISSPQDLLLSTSQFLLLYLASCVCFVLQIVWHVCNAPLSTQQNSLRLCCSCFHRNVISSHPARAICVFSHGGQTISLPIFSPPLFMRWIETQEGTCLGSLVQKTKTKQENLTFRANRRLPMVHWKKTFIFLNI